MDTKVIIRRQMSEQVWLHLRILYLRTVHVSFPLSAINQGVSFEITSCADCIMTFRLLLPKQKDTLRIQNISQYKATAHTTITKQQRHVWSSFCIKNMPIIDGHQTPVWSQNIWKMQIIIG